MCKRYHVILNNGHDMRKCVSKWDNEWDAITDCQNQAIASPTDTFTVIDMQPKDYKYDIYYAEYTYNLYLSTDGELWDRIEHRDID